ncbi:Hypothetical predicted protein [Paramuricea clavata]|uniref:Uncharacterized protein n=1 Tax=Paramuricea clavata TaxID=317549 RepID=A0A6S7HR37_PARCT|nr:Hypothetical predicted protein [Paramuricea clavata]
MAVCYEEMMFPVVERPNSIAIPDVMEDIPVVLLEDDELESEPILDCNVEIATATLENEESNQQGNQIRQNKIDNPNVYPLLDDRSLHDDLQNLPVTRVLEIRRVNIMQDMIENFKDESIMQIHVKVVMINKRRVGR